MQGATFPTPAQNDKFKTHAYPCKTTHLPEASCGAGATLLVALLPAVPAGRCGAARRVLESAQVELMKPIKSEKAS